MSFNGLFMVGNGKNKVINKKEKNIWSNGVLQKDSEIIFKGGQINIFF